MELEYVPKACRGDKAKFQGSILLRVPTFDEKYQYIEESGFELEDDGTVRASIKQIGALRKIAKLAEKHCLKVTLEKLDDKKKISSYQEMTEDPDCEALILELATGLLNQFKPGNESK